MCTQSRPHSILRQKSVDSFFANSILANWSCFYVWVATTTVKIDSLCLVWMWCEFENRKSGKFSQIVEYNWICYILWIDYDHCNGTYVRMLWFRYSIVVAAATHSRIFLWLLSQKLNFFRVTMYLIPRICMYMKIEKQFLFFGQQGLSFNIMKRAAIKMQIEIGWQRCII